MRHILILTFFSLFFFNTFPVEKLSALKEEILEQVEPDDIKTEEDAMDELIQACIEVDYDAASAIFSKFRNIITKTLNLAKKPRIRFKDEQERARVLKSLENFKKLEKTFQKSALEDRESQLGFKEWLWKHKWRVVAISGATFAITIGSAFGIETYFGPNGNDVDRIIAGVVSGLSKPDES